MTDSNLTPQPDTTRDYKQLVVAGAVVGGRYTLANQIGEGGMGEVWIAKQTEPVKRNVALKLIKAGMDSKAVMQRFEQERQALAMMDHPNIAKVLDGGLTDDRRPFFVMELVTGQPLTKFCDDAKLGIRERLELFAQICQAVQHAHQKGIIHRDLKPSNILVTMIDGRGVPKVIDFGVAKATAGRLTDESISTQFGAVVGTLEYMSPEQAGFAGGTDVDTRTDVYSLGVILYELLTGLKPIDADRLKKAALNEMIRIIQEDEPTKPSTRFSTDDAAPSLAALRHSEPKKLAALLRGELDWVVMKCLEKDRSRRYETASGLARDIQRYLANEVVEARPASAGYRLRKFVSRHKGQVAAAVALLLVLLVGIVGTTWGLVRANKANNDLADKNRQLAVEQAKVQARFELAQKAIATFHSGVSEDVFLKTNQFKELRTRLLKQAADFYADLEKLLEGQNDAKSRKLLAEGYYELGDLTEKIGSKSEALAVHRKGLAARRELAAADGADVETRLDVARSLAAIGLLLRHNGDPSGAMHSFEEQMEIATKLLSESATAPVWQQLGRAHENIAGVLLDRGKRDEASERIRQALSIRQKLAEAHPDVTLFQIELTQSHIDLSNVLTSQGKRTDALKSLELAKAVQQKLADDNPGIVLLRRDLGACQFSIGFLLSETDRAADALAAYREALSIRQRLVDDNPAINLFQSDLAVTHNNIGLMLKLMGQPVQALEQYRLARDIQQKLAAANPTETAFQSNLASSNFNIGTFLAALGQTADSLVAFGTAQNIYQQLADANPSIPEYPSYLGACYNNIGNLLAHTGALHEALESHKKGLPIRQKLANDNPSVPVYQAALATSLNNIGKIEAQLGERAQALESLDAGLLIRQKLVDSFPTNRLYKNHLGYSYAYRGWAHFRAGQPADAARDLRQAVELWKTDITLDIDARFERCRALAILAGLAADSASGVTSTEASSFRDQSIAALRDAIKAGWSQAKELKEPDFDSIRQRDDFKQLQAALAKKAVGEPTKQP